MTGFSVNVDVTNPGQFFACCGILELAHRLWPGTVGWFQGSQFTVASDNQEKPNLADIIQTMKTTDITPETEDKTDLPRLRLGSFDDLLLDWWRGTSDTKTPFKLWSGQQTPLKILKDLVCGLQQSGEDAYSTDLFNRTWPLTGRFGFDPRAAWNALETGFSPNEQGMQVATFPAVELLAAVGLQRCPRIEQDHGFLYATWTLPLPVVLLPAAVANLLPLKESHSYRFTIARRGSYKCFSVSQPIF